MLSPYRASLLPKRNTPLSIQSLNKILSHMPCPIPGGLHPGGRARSEFFTKSDIPHSPHLSKWSCHLAKCPSQEWRAHPHHLSDTILPHLIHHPPLCISLDVTSLANFTNVSNVTDNAVAQQTSLTWIPSPPSKQSPAFSQFTACLHPQTIFSARKPSVSFLNLTEVSSINLRLYKPLHDVVFAHLSTFLT